MNALKTSEVLQKVRYRLRIFTAGDPFASVSLAKKNISRQLSVRSIVEVAITILMVLINTAHLLALSASSRSNILVRSLTYTVQSVCV